MNRKRHSSACSLLALLLLLSIGSAEEPRKVSQFKVSGPVAGKLPDDFEVTIWPLGEDHGDAWPIREMPIRVPWERYGHSYDGAADPTAVYVDFQNDSGGRIMSVLLSRDLLDKPRTIDITLKRPSTFVKPASIFGLFGFRYHALISRRMQYSALPKWDGRNKEFLEPSPPVLRIYTAAESELLQESEMLCA